MLATDLVMDCGLTALSGYGVSSSWLMPGLQLSQFLRAGVLSEAFGASVVWGEFFIAGLSDQLQIHQRIFLSRDRFRQLRRPGVPGMILLFPQREMLPSFRPASQQLIPGRCSQTEVFRARLCSSAHHSRPYPHHTLCHPGVFLSYQPALLGANLL